MTYESFTSVNGIVILLLPSKAVAVPVPPVPIAIVLAELNLSALATVPVDVTKPESLVISDVFVGTVIFAVAAVDWFAVNV